MDKKNGIQLLNIKRNRDEENKSEEEQKLNDNQNLYSFKESFCCLLNENFNINLSEKFSDEQILEICKKLIKLSKNYPKLELSELSSFTLLNSKPINQTLSCCICLSEINHSNKYFLKCGHHFHSECIQKWFEYSNHCPICKQLINQSYHTIFSFLNHLNDSDPPLFDELDSIDLLSNDSNELNDDPILNNNSSANSVSYLDCNFLIFLVMLLVIMLKMMQALSVIMGGLGIQLTWRQIPINSS